MVIGRFLRTLALLNKGRSELRKAPMAIIDELIRALQDRLKQARKAKRLFADDPAVLDQVGRAMVLAPILEPPPPQPYPNRQRTVWQTIHEHFLSTGNQGASVAGIVKATGLKQSAVMQVLYRTHKHLVESEGRHGFGRVAWRLKETEADENSGFST